MQVMDQVVVLVHQQRREPALAADPVARRLQAVLLGAVVQPIVGEVVECEREVKDCQPLR